MKLWDKDKAWADTFDGQIARIIQSVAGEIVTLRVASREQDRLEATDYVAVVAQGEIACRVRRDIKPWRDFTLRNSRPSGVETEVEKIRQGWARWYLYGWAQGGKIAEWIFVDLDALRARWDVVEGAPIIRNHDGSSDFRAIALHRLAGAYAMLYHEYAASAGPPIRLFSPDASRASYPNS